MLKGFSVLEVLIAMTVCLVILTLVISNVSESVKQSKRVMGHQEKMESIFHTVEMLRSDLVKCGMRLQEASKLFGFPLFENGDINFKVVYGIEDECLLDDGHRGENIITVNRNDFFKKGKKLAIYNPDKGIYEVNRIQRTSRDQLILEDLLQNDYPKNSLAVVLKEVEYKLYKKEQVLKRKVNRGYFQPLVENVTGFYVRYYPESSSVLYRIEVDKKEQIRGYIFLINLVKK